MTQLTSDLGLSFAPLESLIREASEERSVHPLMAIESLDHLDVYPSGLSHE